MIRRGSDLQYFKLVGCITGREKEKIKTYQVKKKFSGRTGKALGGMEDISMQFMMYSVWTCPVTQW